MHIIFTLNQILGFQNHPLQHIIFTALTIFFILTFISLMFFSTKHPRKVYLLDFACYKSSKSCMCSRELAIEKARRSGLYSEETLDFMKKSLQRSGLGDSTYVAECLLREPINICMEDERREAEMTIFGSIDLVLKKCGVEPKEIGILVVNGCVYNSVPSISSLIVNHYKLRDNVFTYNLSGMGCSAGLIAIGLTKQLLQPPMSQMCTREVTVEKAKHSGYFSEETVDFMKKSLERSGLGDSTYLAETLLREPADPCMEDARREAEMTVFGSIDMLLKKTGVQGNDIGILIVNCCIFNMVPSLSSMIVNRYKLKDNIVTYNLSGMGCSAGLVAIGLAKQLLQVHKNSYVLVVSTESISDNCYKGNDRSKFLINCIFRVGGAAILLSNRPTDERLSKYQLFHTVHTHTANSDRSYNCIFLEEDDKGHLGVNVTKNLLAAAVKAIESNLTSLGYLILPLSEKIFVLKNYISRKVLSTKIKPYIPDFNKAVDHFFPHVGGKPVLDTLQRSLGISDANMEASRMTLYRFGNTSSSSIWYELAYAEAKGRIKKGDSVWQIAFGSGFKCSSVIWKALGTVEYDETNPWSEEIDKFPVNLDNIGAMPFFFEPPK